MKGNNELNKIQFFFKQKVKDITETNSKKYFIKNSNKSNNSLYNVIFNKNNLTPSNKQIIISNKLTNSINANSYQKKFKYNKGLIHNTYKKNLSTRLYQSQNKLKNSSPVKNLSGYKKILDKMYDEYTINNENSKDNINKLLKKSFISEKNSFSKSKKTEIFSPINKNSYINYNFVKIKPVYLFGNKKSINKKNEIYKDKIIKIQSAFRGYYLRKIVVRGLKKYYGIIFIYKLLKRIIFKRKKKIYELFKKIKLDNMKKGSAYRSLKLKNEYLYSKKIFYNNSVSNEDSDKNAFSFSKSPNDLEKNNENNGSTTKKGYNRKKKFLINTLNHNIITPKIIKNKFSNYIKGISVTEYDNNNNKIIDNNSSLLSMKKNQESYTLASSSNKGDEKNIKKRKIFTKFFNKYEEKNSQPINVNTAHFFRKQISKINQNNKKYIYIHKNINQKCEKNFSSEKASNYNTIKYLNKKNNENNYKISNTLYNVYKFILLKIFKFIKNKFYETHYLNFIYQLKIKRKIFKLKKYYLFILLIILKIKKKRIKKYLDIYRENVLTIKAKDLIKYKIINNNNSNNKNFYNKIEVKSNIKNDRYQKKTMHKAYSNNNIIKNIRNERKYSKNEKSPNINIYIENNYNKKDLLMKLFKIKNKYINKLKSLYFNTWSNICYKMNSKLKKETARTQIKVNRKNGNEKIIVKKKNLRIKRINKQDISNNLEKKYNSLSKEKKMRIIKRMSDPDEYISLYNSFNKKMRNNSFNLANNNIFIHDEKDEIIKVYSIINKLESKKLLFRFFKLWKKEDKTIIK